MTRPYFPPLRGDAGDRCARCGADLARVPFTGSYFDTSHICVTCREDERTCPNYDAAVLAEHAACLAGDFNFPGIGMTDADRAHLEARIAARGRTA